MRLSIPFQAAENGPTGRKLNVIMMLSSHFREVSSWRKVFKKDWKLKANAEITILV